LIRRGTACRLVAGMNANIVSLKARLTGKFAIDSVWLIVSTILIGFSGLLTITIANDSYGVHGMGALMQAISIYTLWSTVGNLGIQTSAQKHAAQFSDHSDELAIILSSAFLATILTALTAICAIILLLQFFPGFLGLGRIAYMLPPFLLAIFFFSINKTINNFCAGLRLMRFHSSVKMARWTAIIIGLLILNDSPLASAGLAFLVAEIIVFCILVFRTRAYFSRTTRNLIRTHLYFGAKSVLGELTVALNSTAPTLLVGSVLGNTAVGYFSYAENFARSVLMVSSAMQKNFNPIFTKIWYGEHKSDVEPHIRKMFFIQLALLAPAFLLLCSGYYFYSLWFMGESYLQQFNVLLAFFPAILLMFLFGPLYGFLIMTSHLNWNFFRAALFVSLNIGLTALFLPVFDIAGAAYALSLASLFNFIFFHLLYQHLLGLNLLAIIFGVKR